jgi:heparin/heparan-sulfate lyase
VDFTAGGAWRVEISPMQAAGVNYFLNVMQVMDQNVAAGLQVQLIQSTEVTGVRIADRIVLFNKTSERSDQPVSFAVEGSNTFRYLITDLAPGMWQVRRDGQVLFPALPVTEEEGTLYFEGPAGKYTLLR